MTEGALAAAAGRACPSCGGGMRREGFERKLQGRVDLDLCFDCQAIWFDQYESAQLTPGSVLALFRIIHERREHPARPIGGVLRCVRCRERLALTHDVQRTNAIVYYRCPEGHGRFTTFLQFLREKSFVRSLTPLEVERLRAKVTQVRCSSCGGPIDLARDAQCPYCRAPIAILDADAVERALADLSEQERRRKEVDPTAAVEALLAGQRLERRLERYEGGSAVRLDPVDLVSEALGFLTRHLG